MAMPAESRTLLLQTHRQYSHSSAASTQEHPSLLTDPSPFFLEDAIDTHALFTCTSPVLDPPTAAEETDKPLKGRDKSHRPPATSRSP